MRVLLSLTFLLVGFLGLAQNKLTVQFDGITEREGSVLVKVSNASGTLVDSAIVPIPSSGKIETTFTLPAGKYAIASFHDANNNRELDTNMMGIPNEKYGFSNNARGMFGPPDLEDQLIDVRGNVKTSITLE